jgi:hypothetical protein
MKRSRHIRNRVIKWIEKAAIMANGKVEVYRGRIVIIRGQEKRERKEGHREVL